MSQSENAINPYVRLTVDEDENYYLEVMLPVSEAPAEPSVKTGNEIERTSEIPEFVNCLVEFNTPTGSYSATEYKLINVPLGMGEGLNGIMVRVHEQVPPLVKGPKADGRTIIQFEDAVR